MQDPLLETLTALPLNSLRVRLHSKAGTTQATAGLLRPGTTTNRCLTLTRINNSERRPYPPPPVPTFPLITLSFRSIQVPGSSSVWWEWTVSPTAIVLRPFDACANSLRKQQPVPLERTFAVPRVPDARGSDGKQRRDVLEHVRKA